MASWLIVLLVTLFLGTALNLLFEMDPSLAGDGTLWHRLGSRPYEFVGPYAIFAFPGWAVALLDSLIATWAAILVATLLIGVGFLIGPELARERSSKAVWTMLKEDGPLFALSMFLVVGGIALGYLPLFEWLS